MFLLQQLIQLLSESPGNIIFHLVLLFAAQALLAMATWTARQFRHDGFARRLAVAGAGFLVTRLILLVAYAVASPDTAPGMLPPLEQGINTATILLVTWALVPPFRRVPRLTDAFFMILLLLSGLLYGLFAFSWATQLRHGITISYNSSSQTVVWSIVQLSVLGLGLLLSLRTAFADRWLRGLILLLLALAHFAHLWNYPELLPSDSDIPYWIRFGQLVALPLLVVLTYRHLLRQLLAAQLANRPQQEQMAASLRLSAPVIESLAWHNVITEGARLLSRTLDVDFSAIAVHLPGGVEHLHLVSQQPVPDQDWLLRLDSWPAFRLAMEQKSSVILQAQGMGARQLYDLGLELGVGDAQRLLVEPMLTGGDVTGLVLIASGHAGDWSAEIRELATALAAYVAAALRHAREQQPPATTEGASLDALQALRIERDNAQAALQMAQERLAELETLARSSALDLPDIVGEQAAVPFGQLADGLAQLDELHGVLKSGVDSEEAELDEAREQIEELKWQLAAEAAPAAPSLPGRATPNWQAAASTKTMTPDAAAVIEDAVGAVTRQVQEKSLRLYLDIHPDLPPVPMEREKLYQIMSHLLENACQASPENGHVAIRAQAALAQEGPGQATGVTGFLQLSVQDTGVGVQPGDQTRVFEPHFKAAAPAIPGIGDTGIGLSIVQSLVQAHGGRVWVEGKNGQGSTFKVLLPLSANGTTHGAG